jgi:peptidoglycan/LPS O-acetylase OafA/YrhL
MTSELANYIGFLGMALIVSAYAYVTAAKAANPFLLHGLNLVGAVLLVLSLTVNRNLPSMVLESVWAAVALFGLAKALLSRRPPPLQGRGLGDSPPSPTVPPEGERES